MNPYLMNTNIENIYTALFSSESKESPESILVPRAFCVSIVEDIRKQPEPHTYVDVYKPLNCIRE